MPAQTNPPAAGPRPLPPRITSIDALRGLANLPAYWIDYSAPPGAVLATDQTDMRTAVDQAVFSLVLYHLTFSGPTPARDGGILADPLNQLRTAVK